MKKVIWIGWLVLTVVVAGVFAYKMLVDTNKQDFLIGEASHGHYQIEMACTACHTEPFGGKEMLQNACLDCHKSELDEAHDSHPKKKFNDPRNADRLQVLDARYCITCHTEHQEEQTRSMGLTLPEDYCFHCHVDIGEERESHRDLAFDSCASAGCHNYHDNRALYEKFLVENAGGHWLGEIARIAPASAAAHFAPRTNKTNSAEFETRQQQHPEISGEWSASSHGAAGISCGGCHGLAIAVGDTAAEHEPEWLEKPGLEQCQSCHKNEVETYLAGKHGMRLQQGLPAMTSKQARLPFQESTGNVQHGCTTCHGAHSFDTRAAAVDACLDCHADDHSLAFRNSPHGRLHEQAMAGEIARETAVTCATCHMPRQSLEENGTEVVVKPATAPATAAVKNASLTDEVFTVNHNQNLNLRPNEKMIRPVCLQCHNLEFSIDALADPALIKNNFSGSPAIHVPSVDWATSRVEE